MHLLDRYAATGQFSVDPGLYRLAIHPDPQGNGDELAGAR